MKKFLAILFSVVVTLGAITVLGANVNDPYEFDGDVITNPFWWLYTTEAPETETEPTTVETNWVLVGQNSNNNYYYDKANMTVNEVVSIQQPGWASELGIYLNVSEAITSVTVNGVSQNVASIDGAGAVVYLSALTQDVNEVIVKYGNNTAKVLFKKEALSETEVPTEKPTEAPTEAPTEKPTVAPVELKITSQPQNLTAKAGEKAVFSLKAEGEGLTYQWQVFSSSNVWANTSIAGNKTNRISFTIPASYKTKQYRCIVSDKYGNSVTSDVAVLTVGETVEGLTITKQPQSITAPVGKKVSFNVVVAGSDKITYQWQTSSNGTTWKNTKVAGHNTAKITLTIPATYTVKYYRVIVTDATTGKSVTSDAAKLTVGNRNLAITSQPANVTAGAGNKATFKVVATGTGLTYQWQTSSDGTTWNNTKVSGHNTDTISLVIPASYKVKYYRVIVTDVTGASVTSSAAKLTVGKEGLAITSQPKDLVAKAGATAKFSVSAVGANLTYQWQTLNASGSWVNTSIAGNKTNTISFKIPASYKTKQYRCIVKDGSGNTVISDVATLTVQ